MVTQTLRFALSATLLIVSASFARADTYSIVSSWQTGSVQYGDLDSYTGDGTFSWNGTSFSLISFTFTDGGSNHWTATPGDGELLTSNTLLILGNGATDCSGADCVGITLSPALATGGPLTAHGVSGFSQGIQTTFDSATVTDTSYSSPVPEPDSVTLLLTAIVGVGLTGRKRLRQLFATTKS